MKMWGVEIRRLNNKWLLKGKKRATLLKHLFILSAILFACVFIFSIYSSGLDSDTDSTIANVLFTLFPVMFLGFGVAEGYYAWHYHKILKECEAEIEKRLSSGELTNKDYEKAKEEKKALAGRIAYVVIIFVIVIVIAVACSSGSGSSSSGRKWSELSDVEKENAKWAYEVKQELDKK